MRQVITHYEVLDKLGQGGMGVVYRARDTMLGRLVALKLLHASAQATPERRQRFLQEARAASALNHPNIVTIYETGSSDGADFIAMELVEGRSLDQVLNGHALPLSKALAYAVQMADALSAAHAAGIAHRDLKPANAMITPEGRVKLVDFGLAKLTDPEPVDPFGETGSVAGNVHTAEGTVMGTAAYMSPEQAEGKPMDGRTDIFSFGSVLYEMLTGQRAFAGETRVSTLAAILREEPRPVCQIRPEIPAEAERIVNRCLKKNPARRFQTAADLKVALEELSEESQARPRRRPARRRRWLLSATLASVAALASAVALVQTNRTERNPPFERTTTTLLTRTGKVRLAAISPDGKYVAYTEEDEGQLSLWLRQVATTSAVQLLPPSELAFRKLVFSPDGDHIFFSRQPAEALFADLYTIPTLGGVPSKVTQGIVTLSSGYTPAISLLSIAPDGGHIALVRYSMERRESSLVVTGSDGHDQRTIAALPDPAGFSAIAWSPQGNAVAFSQTSETDLRSSFFEAPVSGGVVRRISPPFASITAREISWLPGGKHLLVLVDGSRSPIYSLSYPSGQWRRVTNDPINYVGLSLTSDGTRMVSVQRDAICNVWAGDSTGGNLRQITVGSNRRDGSVALSWNPEDQIVYDSSNLEKWSIWRAGLNTKGPGELILGNNVSHPAVSPDGRYLSFVLEDGTRATIYRANADGSNPVQLTKATSSWQKWSPDSKWIVYLDFSTAKSQQTIWKMTADGGTPIQLNDRDSGEPVVSPDGKWIAYMRLNGNLINRLEVIPFEGGEPVFQFDLGGSARPRWTPDGLGLAYLVRRKGVDDIWVQPLEGGPAKQLTHFASGTIFNFAWSRDGKKLALARGGVSGDIVVIANER